MHIGIVALAAGALIVTGCKTTDTAAVADDHEMHVSIERHIMKGDHADGEKEIKIHIIRDGEEPIHIEGDPDSPDVKKALAKLAAEGIVVPGDTKHMLHSMDDHGAHMMKMDGDKQVWIMKMDSEEGGDVTIDMDIDVSEDGKHLTIRHGDKVETIVIPQGFGREGDGDKRHFVFKSDDGKHVSGDMSDHKVIIIKGDNEEEIRKKLDELGLDIDIDVVFDEDYEIEVEVEVEE